MPLGIGLSPSSLAGWSDAEDDTSPLPRLTASGAIAVPEADRVGAPPDGNPPPDRGAPPGRAAGPDHALRRDRAPKRDRHAAKLERTARREQERAARQERVLLVDHVFVYTGAVQKIKQLIDAGDLGRIYYYDSVRVNLGLFQNDVNVIWDLATHDIAIFDYLMRQKPQAVSAVGLSHIDGQPENIAYITCYHPDDVIGHLHVNWLAPVKVRRILIGASRKMIVYDDLEPSEKVKVYEAGVDAIPDEDRVRQARVGYRMGDVHIPQLERTEALRRACEHFAHCIVNRETPLTDGEAGLRVLRILEAAQRSVESRGGEILL